MKKSRYGVIGIKEVGQNHFQEVQAHTKVELVTLAMWMRRPSNMLQRNTDVAVLQAILICLAKVSWMLCRPIQVSAMIANHLRDVEMEEIACVNMRFEKGMMDSFRTGRSGDNPSSSPY